MCHKMISKINFRTRSSDILRTKYSRDVLFMFCIRRLDSRLDLRRHYGRATHDKRTTRWKVAQARELARHHQVRLELEREKRTSLRTSLIRQYEEETRPKWAQRERESVKGSDTTKERRNHVFSSISTEGPAISIPGT